MNSFISCISIFLLQLLVSLSMIGSFVVSYGQALPPQEQFRHLTIEDGLSQNTVRALLQDHQGFVWIGTKDGLNRYDGYEFTVFQHSPGDRTSLSDNYILALFEDRDHTLWVGTSNGLNRYNARTGLFERLDLSAHTTLLNPDIAVSEIAQDSAGYIWVAINRSNLVKLVPSSDTPGGYRAERIADTFDWIRDLYCDAHHLWVGDNLGLHRFGITGSEFTHYTILPRGRDSGMMLEERTVSCIQAAQDSAYLWIGTRRGISYFEKASGTYQFFPHRYADPKGGWGTVFFVLPDPSNDHFWLGTLEELMRFDPATGRYDYFPARWQDPSGFHGTGILTGLKDRSGQLWFGTNGYGINLLPDQQSQFKTLKYTLPEWSKQKNFSIRAICKDLDGNIWIGATLLYCWNRQNGTVTSYENTQGSLEGIGNYPVWSLMQDREGWLWIAGSQGLHRYQPQEGKTVSYRHVPNDPTSLPESEVFQVYEDIKGQIWAVTRNFLVKLNRENGTFTSLQYRNVRPTGPVFVKIWEDRYGKFWLSSEIGLIHFDPTSWALQTYRHDPEDDHSISSNQIRHLCPDPVDPDRYLWLATAGGGLNRFDRIAGTASWITSADGLPDNVIYSILPDETGRLWLSTNQGISCFDPVEFTFENYDARDGLQSNEFNSGAYFRAPDGELFFGGIKGVSYFYPGNLRDNNYVPPIHLTGLQVGAQYIRPGDTTGILQQHLRYQPEVTLSYRDDAITFFFASMDLTAPEKNRFAYRLEGWDRKWVEAGTRNSATYSNLPAGAYTFFVRGSNSDNVWNETGAAVNLRITPPFWLTPWAKVFYIFAALGIGYALLRYQQKRAELKHQLSLEQVEKEKLRELDQLKSKFFADIAHELRTPLTLILGVIEQLNKRLSQKTEGKNLSLLERHSSRLLSMVNQIMDLAKLESGKAEIYPREGDLIRVIRGVTESYKALAMTRGIDLLLTSPYQSVRGAFDHQKLEQVLHNLLSNALKYARPGDTVKVIIEDLPSAEITAEGKQPISFMVTDTGPGIDEANRDRIFQRFYRMERDREEGRIGSGVGLALVKELVELHGGTVSVDVHPDYGTRFCVTLPLYLDTWERKPIFIDYQAELPPLEPMPQPDSTRSDAHENTVLIIEDDIDVQAFVSQILATDFGTVVASSGKEGIARAREVMPDLIVTDVMMPGMNGFEVCEQLTHSPLTSHIPVIMLTARTTREDRYRAYKTGADVYLTKPFKSEELLLRTRLLIEKRQMLRAKFSTLIAGADPVDYRNETENTFQRIILEFLQAELANPDLDVARLAQTVHMSERQLRRKFRAVLGQSPNQFIRTLRLQRAHKLLRSGSGNVSEICFAVGFNNLSYFGKCFRETYGISPSEVSVSRPTSSE